MPSDSAAIHLSGVTKRFDQKLVVHSATLTIPSGRITTLIGPNGTGKTTLIKMIVGLLTPTSGVVTIFGQDIQQDPIASKKLFGYISDDPSAYEYLSGFEFLSLTGKLRGMPEKRIQQRIREVKSLFPLKEILEQPMAYYSRGSRQKVALLAALLDEPKLLLIDEPIVGLDPQSIDIFGEILRQFSESDGTVFFVTHTLSFANQYANDVYVMNHGKIVVHKDIRETLSLKTLYEQTVQE